MAAGRHHGNEFRHPENEFRDPESDFDLSKQNSSFSKNCNPNRHGDINQEQGSIRGLKGRSPVRQKYAKERDVVNGEYNSSSSKSDLESKYGFRVRSVDREPGELSSDSGSDDATHSEILIKDTEFLKIKNETRYHLNPKHRKFSPILWDRDEKKVSILRSITVDNGDNNIPPTKLPKALGQLPNLITNEVDQNSPKNNSKFKISNASLVKHPVTSKSHGGAVSETLASSSVLLQQHWSNDNDVDRTDDESCVPTAWNITASRWADKANSPVDEGNVSDKEEMPKKRRRVFHSGSSDLNANNRTSSPGLGDLRRDGKCSKTPDSVKATIHAKPFSSDGYLDNDYRINDFMVLDDEHDNIGSGSSLSKSDSDDADGSDFRNTSDTPIRAHHPQRSVDMLQCCRSVNDFERLNQIDEGTYGIVYRARDNKTGEIVALKKIKMEKEREGFPLTSLREINILLSFHHPSIVDVKEVVVGSSIDSIYMVMEYMEHDLKALMETMKQPFSQSEVKCLMLQLLEGVKYLHDNWVLHRDLKTSNLLLNNRGELKICDFGLSRQYGSPLKPYTHLVVTLWYRAPELLLGAKQYSTAIDMWSLGCIMAEILSKKPLFDGKTEVDQLDKIFRTLGTPSESIWPGFSKLPGIKFNFVKHQYNLLRKKFPSTSFIGSPILSDSGFDLLNKLLTYDPDKRITAVDALNHEWFREVPLPKSKDFMPTFPAKHDHDRRLRRIMKSPDPLEEQRRKELQQGESGMRGLFC